MKDGPFIDAYKNGKILILDEINLASKTVLGKILILDEINLASKTVLECIEAALDNDFLSIDMLICLGNH